MIHFFPILVPYPIIVPAITIEFDEIVTFSPITQYAPIDTEGSIWQPFSIIAVGCIPSFGYLRLSNKFAIFAKDNSGFFTTNAETGQLLAKSGLKITAPALVCGKYF